MDVKPGYKQTEVGVIPIDWHTIPLEGVVIPNGLVRGPFGGTLKKECFVDAGYKVYEQRNAIYATCEAGTYFVDSVKFRELERFRVRPGDLIVSCSGTIGCIYEIPDDAPDGIINQALLKITLDGKLVDPRYFLAVFRDKSFQSRIKENSHGGAMQNLVGMPVFRQAQLPVPPTKVEQEAIAGTLEDADALIDASEQLVAKKRQIKLAAMQELLTGNNRLPGFTGEWEVKRLGEVAYIKTGSRNNEDKIEDGQYPFFVRSEVVECINSYSHDCEAILVPGEGRIGSIFHYIHGRFDVHQRVYAITQFMPDISAKFIHLYLSKNFGAWAMQNTVKATVDSLRLPTFQTFEMKIPPTRAEQNAIAAILSDMDSEILALEVKLAKARHIKQGMMQELLTGKIRLVQPQASSRTHASAKLLEEAQSV